MRRGHRFKPCPVTHEGIRSVLTDEQLSELEKAARPRTLQAGELLFEEGDSATHSFIVTSGVVKLRKIHPNKERYIIGLMFPGDFLSGAFKPCQSYSAVAATDVKLCAIPHEACEHLFKDAAELERAFFRASLSELEACHEWTLLLRGSRAYERVAGFLLHLARRAQPSIGSTLRNEPIPVRFVLALSRGEIAGFLNIKIETVSRQMTLMRERKIIHLPESREVIVPDMELLAAHALSNCSSADKPRCGPPRASKAVPAAQEVLLPDTITKTG